MDFQSFFDTQFADLLTLFNPFFGVIEAFFNLLNSWFGG